MAIKSIRGAATIVDLGIPTKEGMLTAISGLDAVNDAEVYPKLAGIDMIAPYMTEVQGVEGHRVESESMKIYWSEKALTGNVQGHNKSVGSFELSRKGYFTKNFKFDIDMERQAKERNMDLMKLITDTTNGAINSYRDTYLPNIVYYTLIRGSNMNDAIPALNTNFYGAFGAVRGANVTNVNVGKSGTGVNHWFAIKGDNLTAEDIKRVSGEMKKYKTYSRRGVIAMANSDTLWEVLNTINYAGNKDEFQKTGIPAYSIAGVKLVENEYIPDGKILFLDAGKKDIIHRMVSPVAEYRGLGIFQEKGFPIFDNPQVLEGSMFEIFAEGYFIMNRTAIAWLDLDTKDATNGLMQAAGFTALEAYADGLKADFEI